MAAVPAGARIGELGAYGSALLSGWFHCRRTGAPVLLSVAHVVVARPRWVASSPPPRWGDTEGALSVADDDVVICETASQRPIGRILAIGCFARRAGIASFDAMIAEPLASEVVPTAALLPGRAADIGAARVGQRVIVAGASSEREGRVVAVDCPSGHFGSTGDLFIEPLGALRLTEEGDSGALVRDAATGALVGLHVGESRGREVSGVRHAVLACAHPLRAVMDLFELS